MSFKPQTPTGKAEKPSMRGALARLGLQPFTEPAPDEEATQPCFTWGQAVWLTNDLCAKAQLEVAEDVKCYLMQLFRTLPYVDGNALDVLDARQDQFMGVLEKDAQDLHARSGPDQVSLLLTLVLARRAEPTFQAWLDVQAFAWLGTQLLALAGPGGIDRSGSSFRRLPE